MPEAVKLDFHPKPGGGLVAGMGTLRIMLNAAPGGSVNRVGHCVAAGRGFPTLQQTEGCFVTSVEVILIPAGGI